MIFSHWDSVSVQLTSIILTFIAISTMCIVYNVKIRGQNIDKDLSGFLIMMETFILWVEDLVVGIMGLKYRKLTPYAMYLILYIFVGGLFSVLGIDSLATSYTVTLSMGLVTFVLIYYFGFKYQKWGYLKQYVNPIELITQFTPLISISFRLFGNMLGGSVILGLLYAFLIGVQAGWGGGSANEIWNIGYQSGEVDFENSTWQAQYQYFWAGFNMFTIVITPFLHLYFDLFDSGVQALVFTMLTFSYWSQAMGDENVGALIEKKVKTRHRARKAKKKTTTLARS